MIGFVDLHCHFIPGIDDGVRTVDEARSLLIGLRSLGFDEVVATPHMRPGMFENDAAALRAAYESVQVALGESDLLPKVHLASEHFFDDVVYTRLVRGEGLPYPAATEGQRKRSVLIELPPNVFPVQLDRRLFDLSRARLRPVIAHPERYQPVWHDDGVLDPMIEAGACLLLDVCALVGKYGEVPRRTAEKLVKGRAYEAACSDAHRPEDVDVTRDAIRELEKIAGKDEANRLLTAGPRAILAGTSS